MITLLEIQNFKRLRDIRFVMDRLNVLIGANGVGKSSLLEVLSLLSAAVNGKLFNHINSKGGFSTLLTMSGDAPELRVAVEFTPQINPGDIWRYELTLMKKGISYGIKWESLTTTKSSLKEYYPKQKDARADDHAFLIAANNPGTETDIALSHEMHALELRKAMDPGQFLAANFSLFGRAKEAQQLIPIETPGEKAEFLLSYLYNMREKPGEDFAELMFVLKTAFPLFEKLSLPIVANGTVGLQWWESGLDGPLSSFQLSEGTLRFLWLAAILMSPSPAPVILIDEPEVSLHPELLRYVSEIIRDASSRAQVLVATHSDRLVRYFEPSEVVVMDRDDDGFAKLTRADELDIEDWLAEYTLDQLWRMGRLGGQS